MKNSQSRQTVKTPWYCSWFAGY